LFLFVLLLVCTAPFALADTVVLKSGKVLQGTLKSVSDTVIGIDVGGKFQEIAINDIASFTFSPRTTKPATSTPAAAVPAAGAVTPAPAPAATGPVTVPTGTKLTIKTKDAISTASNQAGSKFTSTLEADVAVDGKVVVPKGAVVYGTVVSSRGGRVVGGSSLVVTFTELSINNQMIAIVTDEAGAETGPGGTAKKVGAGALIGAAAGDAGAGAAVGGAVALLSARGNHLEVPAGTVVGVSLKQPVTIP
jgi:hypothetical protein